MSIQRVGIILRRALPLFVAGTLAFPFGACALPVGDPNTPPETPTSEPTENTTYYTYSASGKVTISDYRTWCDPARNSYAAQYRMKCTSGNTVGLPFARVFAVDVATGARLGYARTDSAGNYKISWSETAPNKTRSLRIDTEFQGFPRDTSYASFQIYGNLAVEGPQDLKDVAARQSVKASTAGISCGQTCTMGTLATVLDTTLKQNVSALYLTFNYAYTDSLYVAAYHDYCMGLAKSGSSCPYSTRFAVIDVSDASPYNQTGNLTGFIVINSVSARDSAPLHEFGHALQFWALKLNESTSGSYTPTEAWANFVRLAYQYSQSASSVIDYDGYDIENLEPLCKNDSGALVPYSQGKTSANCKPEEIGINWRAAFWDLYDRNQEAKQYECEPTSAYEYKGDNIILSFGTLLDAFRNSLLYGTGNHGYSEKETSGTSDTSTRNLYDFVYNLASVSGVPYWQVEQTGIYHACQTKQPTS